MTTPLILNVVIVSTKPLLHVYHCQQSIFGASLSEPHTSVTALQVACVCLLAAIYRKF